MRPPRLRPHGFRCEAAALRHLPVKVCIQGVAPWTAVRFPDVDSGDRNAGSDELFVHPFFMGVREARQSGGIPDPRLRLPLQSFGWEHDEGRAILDEKGFTRQRQIFLWRSGRFGIGVKNRRWQKDIDEESEGKFRCLIHGDGREIGCVNCLPFIDANEKSPGCVFENAARAYMANWKNATCLVPNGCLSHSTCPP
jgi:hypothetical protein